jgi:drug/metabolite transporter (DMT)-like permease
MGTPRGDTLELTTAERAARSDRLAGLVLVVVSAVAFGAMPIMGKIAYRSGAEPVALMAARFTVGALVLAAIRRLGSRTPWPARRDFAALFLFGAIGYFTQSIAYFTALQRIPAALVAILLYLYPALVVVIGAVFLRDRPNRAVVACLAVAVAGSALTVGPVRGKASVSGLLLGVLAALVYAVYIVLSSRVVPRVGALTSIVVVAFGAACSYDLAAVLTRPAWPGDTAGWLAVAGLGLVATVVAMLCFFAGLARVGPSDASVVSTVEPVVSVLLGVVVLGERLGAVQYVGALLVLTAVAVLARLRSATPGAVPPKPGKAPALAARAEQDAGRDEYA